MSAFEIRHVHKLARLIPYKYSLSSSIASILREKWRARQSSRVMLIVACTAAQLRNHANISEGYMNFCINVDHWNKTLNGAELSAVVIRIENVSGDF